MFSSYLKRSLIVILIIHLLGCSFSEKENKETRESVSPQRVISDEIVNIDENLSLEEDILIKASVLSFAPNIRIKTNGYNLKVESKLVEFNDNKIQNFDVYDENTPLTNGRNGGRINIQAEHVSGKLNVIVRGQRGGRGKHEACFNEETSILPSRGYMGGSSGSFVLSTDESREFNFDLRTYKSLGGRGGEFVASSVGSRLLDPSFCISNFGNAEEGDQGFIEESCLYIKSPAKEFCDFKIKFRNR